MKITRTPLDVFEAAVRDAQKTWTGCDWTCWVASDSTRWCDMRGETPASVRARRTQLEAEINSGRIDKSGVPENWHEVLIDCEKYLEKVFRSIERANQHGDNAIDYARVGEWFAAFDEIDKAGREEADSGPAEVWFEVPSTWHELFQWRGTPRIGGCEVVG